MNTEQTAQQLELAAQILRTGHPFMVSPKPNGLWCVPKPAEMNILKWPVDKYEIRLVLAAPPDNRPLHNPDKLTAEQVGAGYRLLLEEETSKQPYEVWFGEDPRWRSALIGHQIAKAYFSTYRVPLSTPWPNPKPDPYAALKQAHKEGKVIQIRPIEKADDWHFEWQDCEPEWIDGYEYRIKPSIPPFQLPPPPPGMSWHREAGWTAEMLPQGYRPLVAGESRQIGDEHPNGNGKGWIAVDRLPCGVNEATDSWTHCRTTRPLTFTHCGQTWTYHRPGDPRPCDDESKIYCFGGYLVSEHPRPAGHWFWNEKGEREIIGWRYADEPKPQVPLGPEDVLPGSVVRGPVDGTEVWAAVGTVVSRSISTTDGRCIPYKPLKEDGWIINRSLPLTGKWNPDAWEPCHKPAS